MPLSLRAIGLRSPAFADWAIYCVMEDGKVVGRIYEDRHIPADVRWFWSITAFHVDPAFGITTSSIMQICDGRHTRFRTSNAKAYTSRELTHTLSSHSRGLWLRSYNA
jgi:hypothetical protein